MYRINDFICNGCGVLNNDVLYDIDSTDPVLCIECGSPEMSKHIGSSHYSSDGGKGVLARTPDGFKDVLQTIKNGVPGHAQGDRMNAI